MIPALTWLFACSEGPPNDLRGSLVDIFDLAFDATRARLYDTELSVEYVDLERSGRVAVRLTLRRPDDLAPGPHDLVARGDVGLADEVSGQLPPLISGEVGLTAYEATTSGPVVGTFLATFETADDVRLTLHGAFDTTLEVVDAP